MTASTLWSALRARLRWWRWSLGGPLRIRHDRHNWRVLQDRWYAAEPVEGRPPRVRRRLRGKDAGP